MITLNESRFFSNNGRDTLIIYEWIPDTEPAAILQLHHGVSEHIMRYNDFARYMAKQGVFVVGYDCAGHGRSATPENRLNLGEKDGWSALVKDVHDVQQMYAARFPGKPYYILGHSMGSFVVRNYLADYPGAVSGAIISGTGFKPGAVTAAGKAIASLICKLKGSKQVSSMVYDMAMGAYNKGFGPKNGFQWLSRDEAAVEAYAADPLCGGVPTVGLYRDMFSGLNYICSKNAVAGMDKNLPILLVSGSEDPVGDKGAGVGKTADLFKDNGMKKVSTVLYPGGRHEMLNETNKLEVYQLIAKFVLPRK